MEHFSGGGKARVIELSGNKDYSLGAVPNVTVELIPQAKHSTHLCPALLSTLTEADPVVWGHLLPPRHNHTVPGHWERKFFEVQTIIIAPKGGKRRATIT